MFKKISVIIAATMLAASLTACSSGGDGSSAAAGSTSDSAASTSQSIINTANNADTSSTTVFTERDMTQSVDTTDSKTITMSDGKNVTITEAGVYEIKGSAKDAEIIVDAADDAKVQLVLNGVTLTNSSLPCVYVKNADKVFVTTQKGTTNALSVTGTFSADGNTKTDAVIFSKDDLVLNGEGMLNISSTDNGISGKDDIKITGGTLSIDCASDAIETNDDISVADGYITINSQKDGLHAENDEVNTQGSIYIGGGTLNINASSDGIQGTTTVVIDGGTINISSSEGIEATNVTINDGDITIEASDDGINATNKSTAASIAVTINGGSIKINMGAGDTDGIDSNGDIYITGGTVDISGQSCCDYDGKAEKTGGTLIINGTETDTIPNQMMGGGMGGGQMPGGMGGFNR